MNISSLAGLILGFGMFVVGVLTSGGVQMFGNFWDVPSLFITIGGSLAGVMMSNQMPDFINGLKGFKLIFKNETADTGEVIRNIINLSNIARKEGLLALEEAASDIEDDFLKKGIMLVVDGTDPELVRGILETDLNCIEDRHKGVISVWVKWAELGPAWGMIGTLVGLINMLQKMDDPSTIGPQMAVALVTTFYGSMIANWLCTPTATKLAQMNATEIRLKEVTVEGLLSIQAGENPRVIEEKLKSFLSPGVRESFSTDGREAGGEE